MSAFTDKDRIADLFAHKKTLRSYEAFMRFAENNTIVKSRIDLGDESNLEYIRECADANRREYEAKRQAEIEEERRDAFAREKASKCKRDYSYFDKVCRACEAGYRCEEFLHAEEPDWADLGIPVNCDGEPLGIGDD